MTPHKPTRPPARSIRAELADHNLPCSQNPDLFFEIGADWDARASHSPAGRKRLREAKALCRTCTGRPLCLDLALQERPQHGVWAGLTSKEINALAEENDLEVAA